MRTLIIGAGMAGLTLAAKLSQQGRISVVVERATTAEGGYALGLYPLGSCVLHGLGTYEQLMDSAVVLERYEMSNGSGRVLQAFDFSVLTNSVGPLLMVSRADLLELLESSCPRADLRRGNSVSSLVQHDEEVIATFDNGAEEHYDVVVACDGIDSATRDLVFGATKSYDSGWLLWTWWAGAERFDPTVAREWWGAGSFFGAYPAPGRVMCGAGGPTRQGRPSDVGSLRSRLEHVIEHAPAVGEAIDDLVEPYTWPMRDVRSPRWIDRRVALCGDAAVGFMPTAGVGASCAMRAAAGLADELSKADSTTVPLALELYEKRCRRFIERSQTDSRRLARVMFVQDPRLARLRDELAGRFPASWALREIIAATHRPF